MDTLSTEQTDLANELAETILNGFNRHFRIYQEITEGAKDRFESSNWAEERVAARKRIQFYDDRVDETIQKIKDDFEFHGIDEGVWLKVKRRYISLLLDHWQPELAETFYNSVFCRHFHRRYFHNDHIFIRSAVSTDYIEADRASYYVHYPAEQGLRETIENILDNCGFNLPFEDIKRDVRNITKAICRHPVEQKRTAELNFQIQVVNAIFYRNKAAYIVGQAVNGHRMYPFAVPILNNDRGSLVVDTLLIGRASLYQLFEFSYVYFMMDHPVPSAIVNFLKEMMPERSKEDLYSAIGYQKQGKTDFYRDFLHHLKYSEDQIVVAPGIKGMVMAVFTLCSYPYVFKVIRDKFAPPKKITRKQVEETYQLVKTHDRVGRMADMLEYSYVALPVERFSAESLEELTVGCSDTVSVEEGEVILKHVYIERRMIPLNIAIASADDERLEMLMMGYGAAIKDLAAANIFPGDMLFKNFGVTPWGRIVFYDYDEVRYMTELNFRDIPPPRTPEDEFSAEPWYSVDPDDVFPEEFATFLLTDPRLRKAFLKYHRDLLTAKYWQKKQENIRKGVYEDVFPYNESRRFINN